MTDVAAINVRQGLAMADDGRALKITNMFDEDGDETDDPAAAVVLVIMAAADEWIVVHVDEFSSNPVARS